MIVSPAAPLVGLTDHPPTSDVEIPSTMNEGPPSEDQQLPLRTKAPLMALAASVQDSATDFVDPPTKSANSSVSASSKPPTPPDAAATLSDLPAAAASYGFADEDAALTSSQQGTQRSQHQPQRDEDRHAESSQHGWREALQSTARQTRRSEVQSPTGDGTSSNWRQQAEAGLGDSARVQSPTGDGTSSSWRQQAEAGLGDSAQVQSPTGDGTSSSWRQQAEAGLGDSAQGQPPTGDATSSSWRQQAEAALSDSSAHSSSSIMDPPSQPTPGSSVGSPGRGKALMASNGRVQQTAGPEPRFKQARESERLSEPAFVLEQGTGGTAAPAPDGASAGLRSAHSQDSAQPPVFELFQLDDSELAAASPSVMDVTAEPVPAAAAPTPFATAAAGELDSETETPQPTPTAAVVLQPVDAVIVSQREQPGGEGELEPTVVMVGRMASDAFSHAAAAVAESTPHVVESGLEGARAAAELLGQGMSATARVAGRGAVAAAKVVEQGVDVAAEATRAVIGATASSVIAAAGLTARLGCTTANVAVATAGVVADTTRDVVNVVGSAGLVAVQASGSALEAVAEGVGELVTSEQGMGGTQPGATEAPPVLQAMAEGVMVGPAAVSNGSSTSSDAEVARLQAEVAAAGVAAVGATMAAAAGAAAAVDGNGVPSGGRAEGVDAGVLGGPALAGGGQGKGKAVPRQGAGSGVGKAGGGDWGGEEGGEWSGQGGKEDASMHDRKLAASISQDDESWVGSVAGAAAGALIGCALGPVAGPVGASVGAAVGAAVGGAVLNMGETQAQIDTEQDATPGMEGEHMSSVTPLGAVLGMVTGQLAVASGPLSSLLNQASNESTTLGSISPGISVYNSTTWPAVSAAQFASLPSGSSELSGWVLDASAPGQLVGSASLQNLSAIVAGDSDLEWEDVSPFCRSYAATFNGSVVGVPIGGDTFSLYYRRDLFAAAQLSVPQTWQQVASAAAALNGTFSASGGQRGFGICFGCVASDLLQAIWASLVQTQGTAQGLYFGLAASGQPLAHSALVQLALSQLQAMGVHAPPLSADGSSVGQSCSGVAGQMESSAVFDAGGCAITFGWTAQFKTSVSGSVGVAALPGSTSVWDPISQQVVQCSSSFCPTATGTVSEGGVTLLLNRAPLPRATAALVALNAASPAEVLLRAYNFARELSIPNTNTTTSTSTGSSSDAKRAFTAPKTTNLPLTSGVTAYPASSSWAIVLDPSVPLGPFRSSHTDPGNATAMWVGAGYPAADVSGYLVTVQDSLSHPNAVMQLRMPLGSNYIALLTNAADAALVNLTASTLDITATFVAGLESLYGPVSAIPTPQLLASLAAYQASLVPLIPQPLWPPLILSEEPNSPSTPSGQPPPQIPIPNSRKKSVQRTAIIAISVCLPLLLAAAVGLLLYVKVYPALADSSPKLQKLGRLKGRSHSRQIEGKDGDLGSGGADEGKVGAGSRAVTASGRAAAIATARSSRRRKRFGVVMPPTTSAYSTLVITDIQDSTHLWETLPPAVMDVSLKLHHGMFRELMLKHTGYEAATEGDSFIIGFHTSSDACLFALESQQKLLELPWPKELLEAPVCSPVYAMPRDDDRKGQSTFRGLEQTVGTNSLRCLKRSYPTSPSPATTASNAIASLNLSWLLPPWLHSDVVTDANTRLNSRTSYTRRSVTTTLHCPVVPSARSASKSARLSPLMGGGKQRAHATTAPKFPGGKQHAGPSPAPATAPGGGHISITLGDASNSGSRALAVPSLDDSPTSPRMSMPAALSAAYQHHSLTSASSLDEPSVHGDGARKVTARPIPHALEHRTSLQTTQAVSLKHMFAESQAESGSADHLAVYTVGHIPIPPHIVATALTDPPLPSHQNVDEQIPSNPQQKQQQQQQQPGVSCTAVADVAAAAAAADAAAAATNTTTAAPSLFALHSPATQSPDSVVSGLTADSAGQQYQGLGQQPQVKRKQDRSMPEMMLRLPSLAMAGHGLMSPRVSTAVQSLFTTTLGSVMDEYWAPLVAPKPGSVLVFRGLRVRIGLHSGIASVSETAFNVASRRTTYCGVVLATAKAVADSGNGGMITLSPTTLVALEDEGGKGLAHGVVHHLGRVLINVHVPAMELHVIYPESLLARAPLLQPTPLRAQQLLQPGVLCAPLGCVCIAALHVVGAPTLLAWNERLAGTGLDMVRQVAQEELRATQGYMYDYSPGFLHAAFQSPRQAVLWALKTSAALVYAHWDATLLMHELCEEIVFAHEDETNTDDIEDEEILFKGPRLKGGISMGAVKADLSSSSGHVTYRGHAVASLHRLLTEAKTSQVLCTTEVQRRCSMPLPPTRAASTMRAPTARSPPRHRPMPPSPNLPLAALVSPAPPGRAVSQLPEASTGSVTAAAAHSSPGLATANHSSQPPLPDPPMVAHHRPAHAVPQLLPPDLPPPHLQPHPPHSIMQPLQPLQPLQQQQESHPQPPPPHSHAHLQQQQQQQQESHSPQQQQQQQQQQGQQHTPTHHPAAPRPSPLSRSSLSDGTLTSTSSAPCAAGVSVQSTASASRLATAVTHSDHLRHGTAPDALQQHGGATTAITTTMAMASPAPAVEQGVHLRAAEPQGAGRDAVLRSSPGHMAGPGRRQHDAAGAAGREGAAVAADAAATAATDGQATDGGGEGRGGGGGGGGPIREVSVPGGVLPACVDVQCRTGLGWLGQCSSGGGNNLSVQVRLLIPYLPESAYLQAAQEQAAQASTTHRLPTAAEMYGGVQEERSTVSDAGRQALRARPSGSPAGTGGTHRISARSSVARGAASNPSSPSSRRASGRRSSVIILSRHNSSARGSSVQLASLLALGLGPPGEESSPVLQHLRSSGQPGRRPRSRMGSAAIYGPVPPHYHESLLLMGSAGSVSHQHHSSAATSPSAHTPGGLQRSAGSATAVQKPYSFFAHRSSSAVYRGSTWVSSQHLGPQPADPPAAVPPAAAAVAVAVAISARPSGSTARPLSLGTASPGSVGSGSYPAPPVSSPAQPQLSRSHSLSQAPRATHHPLVQASSHSPASGGGLQQQADPRSSRHSPPRCTAAPGGAERSKLRRASTLTHTHSRHPSSLLGQAASTWASTIARSPISPPSCPLTRDTSLNSYSSYAYAYYTEHAMASPPASDALRHSTTPFPLSVYTNLSHVHESRDSTDGGSDSSRNAGAHDPPSHTRWMDLNQRGRGPGSATAVPFPTSPRQSHSQQLPHGGSPPAPAPLSAQPSARHHHQHHQHHHHHNIGSHPPNPESPALQSPSLQGPQRSAGANRRTSIMVNLVSAADILASLSSQAGTRPSNDTTLAGDSPSMHASGANASALSSATLQGSHWADSPSFSSFPCDRGSTMVSAGRAASTGRPVVVRRPSLTGGSIVIGGSSSRALHSPLIGPLQTTASSPQTASVQHSGALPLHRQSAVEAAASRQQHLQQQSVWLAGTRGGPMSRSGRMSSSHLPALLGDNLPSPGHSSGGAAPGGSGSGGGGGLSMYPQYASHRGGASRSAQLASSLSALGSRDASVHHTTAGPMGAAPASESYLAAPRDALSQGPRAAAQPPACDSTSGPSHPPTVPAPGSPPGQPGHRSPTTHTPTTLGGGGATSGKSHVQSGSPVTVVNPGCDQPWTQLQPPTGTHLAASVSEAEQPASTKSGHPLLRVANSAAASVAAVLSALHPAAAGAAPGRSQAKAMPAHGEDTTAQLASARAREQQAASASPRALGEPPSIGVDEGAGRVARYPPVPSPFQTLSSQCLMPGGEDGEEDTHSTAAVRDVETCRSDPL
ncbi:MAG: hypothetical protein WDW38_002871 [Sanguina aurantia]